MGVNVNPGVNMARKPNVRALLKTATQRFGVRGFARRAGVSAPFIVAVASGEAAPGPKVLKALGWERVVKVEYRKVPK